MNKEEITCKIPNYQIEISNTRDEECLIWISPKAINMANQIDKLHQENKQLKEKIDKAIEYINNNSHYYNADGEIMFTIEEEKEEIFCKELLEILKGDSNE